MFGKYRVITKNIWVITITENSEVIMVFTKNIGVINEQITVITCKLQYFINRLQ